MIRWREATTVDTLFFENVLTVDRMFATTAAFLDGKPASFHATYDPNLGYPTVVAVDPNARVADDEYRFTVLGLRAFLPP